MSIPSVGAIGLDCSDPHELAAFWEKLLDGEVVLETDDVVAVRVGHLILNAYRVDPYVPPTWPDGGTPKQLHIDLAIEDLEGSVERAVALGARLGKQQLAPESYMVMLDPAGHPFCLTTQLSTHL